ncbi:MAG: bifunctional metallophosphatase/5'-nucleotidase [Candidatus Omnitrophica bacterium]|nr:bifunctional metallophosphatase/5'-nucleotidase [Candidatus Omnitrophota bacterium]
MIKKIPTNNAAKLISLVFASLWLLLIPYSVWAEIAPLTILFQGDVHSFLSPDENGSGGAARAAAYFQQVRRQEANVLILNSGDLVTGTPVSLMFNGDPVFHVANHFGLDAAVLGNHEFDNGWQRISHHRDIAQFPILCGNAFVTEPDGKWHVLGDAPYKIFTKGKLRIAVLGVVTENTPFLTQKRNTEGVKFVKAADALQSMAKEASKESDLIVALTHVGIDFDPGIAEQVEGLDLIIGGHSHTVLKNEKRINGVPIVHAGARGRYIGRIDLTADTETDRIVDFNYQLISVDENIGGEDPATAVEVKKWEDQVSELVDRRLGEAQNSFSKNDMIMLANAAFLEATGANFSYQNSGGTRGSLKKGEFSYRDIYNIFPFENTLVVASVLGKDIPKHFYGPEPIDPQRRYKIVTNSFVSDQVQRYLPALQSVVWTDAGVWLRDAVIRYVEKRNKIDRVNLTR